MDRLSLIKNSKRSLLFVPTILMASLWKISYMVGTCFAFFSAVNCVAPLSGIFAGYVGVGVVMLSRLLFLFFTSGIVLSNTLPNFFASMYAMHDSKIIQCTIPALCMILFLIHPQGAEAYAYSFYWIIPIFISLFCSQYLFLHFLGTTFTAHAVGSVLFLYQTHMNALYWKGLIPIVIVERLLFATGLLLSYHGFAMAFYLLEKYSLRTIFAKKKIV